MSLTPGLDQLARRIEDALSDAKGLGGPAADIARHLEQAAEAARTAMGSGPGTEEGLRPAELTTGNDK